MIDCSVISWKSWDLTCVWTMKERLIYHEIFIWFVTELGRIWDCFGLQILEWMKQLAINWIVFEKCLPRTPFEPAVLKGSLDWVWLLNPLKARIKFVNSCLKMIITIHLSTSRKNSWMEHWLLNLLISDNELKLITVT